MFLISTISYLYHVQYILSLILDEVEDFSSNNSLLTFVSGAASDTQCISIDIVDDMDFEETQLFSLSIITIWPSFVSAGEHATVFIQDNNGIILPKHMCK